MINLTHIAFSVLEIQEMVCFVFQLSFFNCYIVVTSDDKGIGKTETSMINEQRRTTAFKLFARDSWAES